MSEKIKILKKGEFFNNAEFLKTMMELKENVYNFLDELDEDDPDDQKILNEMYLELAKLRDHLKEIKISNNN